MVGFFIMLVVVFMADNESRRQKADCDAVLARPEPAAFDCRKAMEEHQAKANGQAEALTCDALAKMAERERKTWERCKEKAR